MVTGTGNDTLPFKKRDDGCKTFYDTIKIADTASLPEFGSSLDGVVMACTLAVVTVSILARMKNQQDK